MMVSRGDDATARPIKGAGTCPSEEERTHGCSDFRLLRRIFLASYTHTAEIYTAAIKSRIVAGLIAVARGE